MGFLLPVNLQYKDVDELTASLSYLLSSFILGMMQGITEPLPISSSGHLVLLRYLFGFRPVGLSFEIIVHFGSLFAIMTVYRRDLYRLLRDSILFIRFRRSDCRPAFHFVWMLILATLVTGVFGLVIEPYITDSLARPAIIGIAFLCTGFFLWLIRQLEGTKSDQDITWKMAVLLGLCQAVALMPGISRSGATLVGAMLLGLKRETALRFSFLLFIPVSMGISLLSATDIYDVLMTGNNMIPYIIAFLTATISTYFALRWFIRIMQKGKLIIFSMYCFLLGTTVLLLTLYS